MTNDLNRKWAELEGWKLEEMPPLQGYNKWGWIDNCSLRGKSWPSEKEALEHLPNWTEPNLFFVEVVPRMIELKFLPTWHFDKQHRFTFTYMPNNKFYGGMETTKRSGTSIGKAGLTAAIQARKELRK